MTNLAKSLNTSVVFCSSVNCCSTLGKSLSLRLPPVTIIKECPWYHTSVSASVSDTKITVHHDILILDYCSVMGINIKKLPTTSFLLLRSVCETCACGGRPEGGGGERKGGYYTKMSAHGEQLICKLSSQVYHQILIVEQCNELFGLT